MIHNHLKTGRFLFNIYNISLKLSSMRVTTKEEEEEELYSSTLQLPEKSKTFELKPEPKVFSSKLERNKEKPVFLSQLSPVAVTAGETARLTVTIYAFPKPEVVWFHNGQIIHSSSVYRFVEEHDEYTLIISNVTKANEGEYSCIASNKFGQSVCTSVLKVSVSDLTQAERWVEQMFKVSGHPPRFTKQIESVQCAEGGEAKFQYIVTGAPPPQIQWFKGSSQIQTSEHFIMVNNPDGTGFIAMMGLRQQDSGLYTCRAFNSMGELTDLEVTREQPSRLMSAISESVTPFTIVKAEPLFQKEEENILASHEPK
uniref:Ig-like domain-containing protein n=1 Tax=Denticeps clupeoides TaxID=299321 RepID=A0AAY4EX96_9TELE